MVHQSACITSQLAISDWPWQERNKFMEAKQAELEALILIDCSHLISPVCMESVHERRVGGKLKKYGYGQRDRA